jgi:small multidrug resistance pump
MEKWIFLIIAIVCEIIATLALKYTAGFANLRPSIIVILGYTTGIYFLSRTLHYMPVGIAYAIWTGVAVGFVALISWIYFREPLDFGATLGLLLITSGIVVINLFSKSLFH